MVRGHLEEWERGNGVDITEIHGINLYSYFSDAMIEYPDKKQLGEECSFWLTVPGEGRHSSRSMRLAQQSGSQHSICI